MRALSCAIALMVCHAPASAETRTSSSSLAILFRFDGPYSQAAFQEMERELTTLMEPSAVRLEWHDRRDITQADSFQSLVMVNFHGRCRLESAGAAADGDKPLAWTHVVDGKVLPFSDVECDRVRASIHSANGMRQLSDLVLGRALARVLAHELYHVLARTSAHAGTGLAKRSLSGLELSSDRLELNPSDTNRMKPARNASP
jgi:hypothetical protein